MGDTIGKILTAPLTLLGMGPKKPPPPPAPLPMPDPMAQDDAKKKNLLKASQRSGSDSTILSDKLGPG